MIFYEKCTYDIEFNEELGCISSLVSKEKEYVQVKIPIFRLAVREEDGTQKQYDTNDMALTNAEKKEEGFLCEYKGCGFSVKVRADISEEIKWHISVDTPKELYLEWVNFPQIIVPDTFKNNGGNSKLLWGFNEGVLIEDMDFRENACFPYQEPSYPSRGVMGMYPAIVETQCMAYYDDDGGMYFAAHDKYDNVKGINFYRQDGGVFLQYRHFCGVFQGEEYNQEFPMVMKFFDGDWHDAAKIYKDWFKEERKDTFTPIRERKDLPEWYGDSPVIVTYPVRGLYDTDEMNPNKLFPYMNAMKHIERLEKEFGSRILVILMHWEGTAPWAPPYVWPPYGGEETLKEFINALHDRGDILGVYCSGLGWTEQSNLIDSYNCHDEFEKKNLKDVMCLSPEQTLPYSNICTDQRVGYDMCPTQEFAINVLREQVDHMAGAGIDYIQLLDQNHGGTPYFCYSKNHGHPQGPGKWQVEAMKNLLKVAKGKHEKVIFGCESAAAESYIPQLMLSDNRFNITYQLGRPTPLYAYIYHEYVNNFMGNQVATHCWTDYEKNPESLLERIAYSFVAGDLITVVLNQEGDICWNWGQPPKLPVPEQSSIKTLIKNLTALRKNVAKEYLHLGSMIKPFEVVCDQNLLEYTNGSMYVPMIHTSAWNSVDEKFGQVLVNYNTHEVKLIIKLPSDDYNVVTSVGRKEKVNTKDYEITLAPLSTVLVERI